MAELLDHYRLSRLIDWWLKTTLDVFAHGLAVGADAARDSRHAQPLSMQIQDHDEFPKPDHHRSPSNHRGDGGLLPGAAPQQPGSGTSSHDKVGNIQTPDLGRMQAPLTPG